MDRDDLDAILDFISAESLTDLEWSTLDIDEESNDLDGYNALVSVLESRELVSTTLDKLNYYYQALGFNFGSTSTAYSNVFVGSVL